MRPARPLLLTLLAIGAAALPGCPKSGTAFDPAEPAFSVALFGALSATVDHPYFPLVPNTVTVFTEETPDGIETIVTEVLPGARVIAGVTCAIVHDQAYLDGFLIEDTLDWYAQDLDGNVWYMGEDTTSFDRDADGNILSTSTEGSWEAEADVAGTGAPAEPGIIMKAAFAVGDHYQQELYEDEAEDEGEIVALDVPVTLSDGRRLSCLQTRDTTPLEPSLIEFKYYAMGVGIVKVENALDGTSGEQRGVYDVSGASLPDFGAAAFTNPSTLTNPYLSFSSGSAFEYEVDTDEGLERTVISVLPMMRVVDGIPCAVVHDQVFLDGVLIEDTHDWYAQDDDGNVWYMGEDVLNYEFDAMGNPVGTNTAGSWEAGVDGAEPGIAMWAMPALGASYLQEFYEDEAEDRAAVVSLDATVVLEDGTTYSNCVQTLEWTRLSPGALEYKFYAAGTGLVLEESLTDGTRVELTGP